MNELAHAYSLDARTKTFMERMYCLRHQTGFNRGKMLHGPEATVASVGVHKFEDDDGLLNTARDLGRAIRRAMVEGVK